MDSFRSSSGPSPDTEVIASSTEHPPFDSLEERNPLRRKRKVYAQRKPLSGLANIRLPGTLHWAVEVITESEIAEDDSGYIWDLAQEKGKIMINTSLWIGADSTRGNLLGYTNLTDREICDHGQ